LTSSLAPAHVASPSLGGVLLNQGPYRRTSPGTLDALGALTVTLPVGTLPAGVDEDAKHLQCVMVSTSGQIRLGSSAVLTRLDSEYGVRLRCLVNVQSSAEAASVPDSRSSR
jgi:hypothetical protein